MTLERKKEIRKLVRQQIISALRQDYEGDEAIMKEAWEQCDDEEEVEIAKDVLGEIIDSIEEGGRLFG